MSRTFHEVAEENGLIVLSREQVESVCKMVHCFMAHAKNIATDGYSTLLIERGNLDYYAGLDYCETEETGPNWKLWISNDDDDQVARVINHAEEARHAIAQL